VSEPKPRPFQATAMAEVGARFREGKRGVCLVAPTGAGKTMCGAMMATRFVAQGKTIAWGAHRAELLTQAADTFRRFGVDVGFRGVGRDAKVQLFTYQEAVASGLAPKASVFIADEGHHIADKIGWERVAHGYIESRARLLGLTATPCRSDGRALPVFDALVVAAQIKELTAMGLLVPLRWRGPSAALASQKIAQRPVDAYEAEAMGRAAIVFAPNIRSAKVFLEEFQERGHRAALVHGDLDDLERKSILRKFATGNGIDILVNVNLLTEGFDAPRCSCVIMARNCGAIVLWIQAVGRGLRPHCGCGKLARGDVCSCLKADCLLLDLRGVAHELGRPDAPATYSLDGAGIVLAPVTDTNGERLCKVCKVPLPPLPDMVCLECGKDHSPPVPKSVNAPLTDWDEGWAAAKEQMKPGKLVMSLAVSLHKAREASTKGKPWMPNAVANRFRIIFGRMPYPQEMTAAMNLVLAAESYKAVDANPELVLR
jgi:DNA repair protein RadD